MIIHTGSAKLEEIINGKINMGVLETMLLYLISRILLFSPVFIYDNCAFDIV